MKIQLTIIVPIFNLENYVNDTLISLTKIRNPEVEVILIDDGSTDLTSEIIRNFLDDNDIINCQFLITEIRGLSISRNQGIELAKGNFVLFCDGDDCIIPGSIDKIIHYLNSCLDYDLIAFQGYDFEDCTVFNKQTFEQIEDIKLIESYNRFVLNDKRIKSDEYIVDQINYGIYLSNACFYLIRKNALKNLRFIPNILYEDIPFTIELFLGKLKLLVISERIILHRRRVGSITRSGKSRKHVISLFKVSHTLTLISLSHQKNLSKIIDNCLVQGLRACRENNYIWLYLNLKWLYLVLFRIIFSFSVRKEFKKNIIYTLRKSFKLN